MNQKISTLFTLFLLVGFMSCTQEDDSNSTTNDPAPLVADFNITVEGEAPNAEIIIENTSQGGSGYEWEFSEGSSQETSTEEEPSGIIVDKTGEFEVSLTVTSGSDSQEKTQTVTIDGNNAIIAFEDIEFDQDSENQELGINFSVSEGQVYTDAELSEDNFDLIDFYFFGCECTAISFFGADDSGVITDGKSTLMRNKNNNFTIEQFDGSTNDSELATIEIEEEMNFIETLDFPHVVTFQLEDGRSGAIKCKEINSDRILVDIKVQKYQ